MNLTKVDKAFYALLIFSFIALLATSSTLSVSYKEVLVFFNNRGIVGFLTNQSCNIFGNNNIAFRVPFIIFSTLNLVLMYHISRDYFRYEKDRIYNLAIFAFLPGVISASLLANEAIIVIFATLVYIYWYKRFNQHNYILLILFLFLDNSFAILFLALCLFAVKSKDTKLLLLSILLFAVSLYFYGFDGSGKPRGYFIDTLAIFATIFSPLLFFYFFYSMYTVFIRGQGDLLWHISFSALIFALVLSLRQKIQVEDFAPFVVISIPFMMRLFLNSMRVRLPEFRQRYYLGSYIVLGVLFLNSSVIFYNTPIYLLLNNPKKHFAFEYSFTGDIAQTLKEKKINFITVDDKRLQKKLKFYGIKAGHTYYMTTTKNYKYSNIKFTYLGHTIYGVNVTK